MNKCKDCGQLAENGFKFCQKHLELYRIKNRSKRAKRRAAGKCTECGTEPPMENYRKCQKCHSRIKKNRELRTEKYNKDNCCTSCGRGKNFVVVWTNRLCAECHCRSKFKWIGTKEEAEKIINDMLIGQDFKCALTGRDLRINKYHIDHIIPRSIDPSKIADPANWQLVVEDANIFKENISSTDIILLAKDIVRKALADNKLSISDVMPSDV